MTVTAQTVPVEVLDGLCRQRASQQSEGGVLAGTAGKPSGKTRALSLARQAAGRGKSGEQERQCLTEGGGVGLSGVVRRLA